MSKKLPSFFTHSLSSTTGIELVLVKAGTFWMGSEDEEADNDEKPVHEVQISQDFYIGRYPVTQAQWKAVMNGHNPSYFTGDNRPVEQVSWLDIIEGGQRNGPEISFLSSLNNSLELESSGLKDWQFRLPTEAEWEYAARGGHKKDNYLYSGSDKLKEVGWFGENSHGETKNVDLKKPNALGLYDMSGNVWEWCRDWFDRDYYQQCYEKGIETDPVGPVSGPLRVCRGGSWFNDAQLCRVASRYDWLPEFRSDDVGFRLVLAPRISGSVASGEDGTL